MRLLPAYCSVERDSSTYRLLGLQQAIISAMLLPPRLSISNLRNQIRSKKRLNRPNVCGVLGEFAVSVWDECFAGIKSADDLCVTCDV